MKLSATDFADFFHAVHGQTPFPWQQELVNRLTEFDEWPDVLDLPTGTGKTAALDAAVFHLARRADTPRHAALRIAFVVDRRLVVDDAFTRAKKIETSLFDALSTGRGEHAVIREVASRLQRLAGDGAPPLIARRLRGGVPLEDDWAHTPTQPTILCSTVDQVGSRLLFRGYGISDRMKPVHAGLLGTDCLILLDEAHLSEPFRQTVSAVRNIGGAGVRVALLSATPGTSAKRRFGLLPDDYGHPELANRLEVAKPATLVLGRKDRESIVAQFVGHACEIAKRLRDQGVVSPAVGIIVNRVSLARQIHGKLAATLATGDSGYDVILLIGRSRSVDRDGIAGRINAFRTGVPSSVRTKAKPLFIVATQCLEVGVDLDLDGLVTQAASLDALRQRYGRVNRAGRSVPAEGVILASAGDIARKADDPVYGDRIRMTWEALKGIAENGRVNFGVVSLPKQLAKAGINVEDLAAERPDAPVVMPAYLELWSRTAPRPVADPDVSLFLHGTSRTSASVSIVWRGDITERDLQSATTDSLQELIRLVPPRVSETIEIPLGIARRWLRGVSESGPLDDISDAPERDAVGSPSVRRGSNMRPAFRWAGMNDPRTGVVSPEDLRPGDVLVVPASYGGCDEFGWAPEYEGVVEDVFDRAAKPFWGRRCAVRITRHHLTDTKGEWVRAAEVLADESLAGGDLLSCLLDVLPVAEDESGHKSLSLHHARQALEALRRHRGRIDVRYPYPEGRERGAVIIAEHRVEVGTVPDTSAPATEDDNMSCTSGRPVPLEEHCQRVKSLARGFARRLDLVEHLDDLGLAAFLHDVGKADRRFQVMLSGGDPWNRTDGPVLAKSGRPWLRNARLRAGLPPGWRHEALSVCMARAHPRFKDARDPALVLWLIGSHHGWGRPFFEFHDPANEQELLQCLEVCDWRRAGDFAGPNTFSFDLNGADWPSLFEGLQRKYGIWRLAHLEAILRLADHRVSEQENRKQ